MTTKKQDQLDLAKQIAETALDGANQPHQEITNKTRYEDLLRVVRPLIKSLEEGLNERIEIEGLKGAPYIEAYLDRSSRTAPSFEDLLISVDERVLAFMQASLGMSKEVGELSDLILNRMIYSERVDRSIVADRIGGLMWFIALLVRTCGLNFQEIIMDNLAKIDKKFPDAGVLSIDEE